MKSVLVTGATGFIGRKMVEKLLSENLNVYAVVRNKETILGEELFENVHIIECEMSEYKDISKFSNIKIDTFYHFAWSGHSGNNRGDYELQLRNIQYTCDAIKLAKELKCKRFIYPGSLIEYEYQKSLQNNFYDVGMGNIYGIAKMTARQMGQVLARNIGIEFMPTTISNIYGVGEKVDRLFKSTLKKLMRKEETKFTNCEQMYDFIYIDDAVEAFYLIGEKGTPFKNYYIGNKEPKKLKEFIWQMKDCVDVNTELGFGKIPFHGIGLEYNEFDTCSLYEDFKFEPKVGFCEGIKKTKQWLEKEGI